ncbi:protein of unknown function [Paenibacillus alvei]|uniref:Uncharacterized protein n=1 Tax=Paenibacillus alvei TaxID=44250 RepID=A0A383R5Y4_PAEAL|nr:protein of unknown function [Paenibacillus alvei]
MHHTEMGLVASYSALYNLLVCQNYKEKSRGNISYEEIAFVHDSYMYKYECWIQYP